MTNLIKIIVAMVFVGSSIPAMAKDCTCKKRQPASVDWKKGHINVYLGGGVRTGKSGETAQVKEGLLGVRVSFLDLKLKDKNTVSIMAPGLSLQTNGELSFSVAPISFTLQDRYFMGVDYHVSSGDNNVGNLGIFLGVRFGADGFEF